MDLHTIVIFIAGLFLGIIIMAILSNRTNKKLKEYQRKLEKTYVQTSEESSRVAVLEAKIQTLEKALQSALENRD